MAMDPTWKITWKNKNLNNEVEAININNNHCLAKHFPH